MGKGGEEGVGIWREVYTCGAGFEIEDSADKGRILV